MSEHDIHTAMVQARGAAYRPDQVAAMSHYDDPIDHGAGRLAGRSHIWGDASPEVQSRVIDDIVAAAGRAGLDAHQTAYVLAIARVESGFNPDAAAGPTSAYGLGQFIDRTGAHYGINDANRGNVTKQAEALVAAYLDEATLARAHHHDEAYVYKYHHDGPTRDYGGLAISENEVMPYIAPYEAFVLNRWPELQAAATHGNAVEANRRQAVLQSGDKGASVRTLQADLAHMGYTAKNRRRLGVDGDFGADTRFAVESFQRDHRLVIDGKVGSHTRSALVAALDTANEEVTAYAAAREMRLAFADLSHPQHRLYTALQSALPQGTSDARLAQATAVCHFAGINKPEDLSGIYSGGTGKVFFAPQSLFANMATLDITRPAPAVQQSLQQVQEFDQRQQAQTQPAMHQQPAQGLGTQL